MNPLNLPAPNPATSRTKRGPPEIPPSTFFAEIPPNTFPAGSPAAERERAQCEFTETCPHPIARQSGGTRDPTQHFFFFAEIPPITCVAGPPRPTGVGPK